MHINCTREYILYQLKTRKRIVLTYTVSICIYIIYLLKLQKYNYVSSSFEITYIINII